MPFELQLILRNFALLGGLLLLHVENKEASCYKMYAARAGLPLLVNRKSQQLMQLTGRILLALMYMTLFQHFTIFSFVLNLFGLILMVFVVMGYRTRSAALWLSLVLTGWNVTTNSWWFADGDTRDLLKYNCFHTLSVVGGLLMVVVLGPGDVSLERYKKQW